jgi:hypothetical protein
VDSESICPFLFLWTVTTSSAVSANVCVVGQLGVRGFLAARPGVWSGQRRAVCLVERQLTLAIQSFKAPLEIPNLV